MSAQQQAGPYTSEDAALEGRPGWTARKSNRGNIWFAVPPALQTPAEKIDAVYTETRAAKHNAEGTPNVSSANRVQSAREFIGTLQPRPWRIKKLQPLDAQLCIVFSDSGDGKSFFVSDFLGCVHRGVPWNGLPVVRGKVVALVAEGGGDYKYRLEAYRLANGLEYSDLFPVIDNAPDLLDAKQAADVAMQIKAHGGCDCLLVDTLSATFSGDEKGSDMNRYLRNLRLIQRKLGCTIWLISHRGKDPSRGVRGHSSQKAAADVEIELTRDEDDTRTAKVTKLKGSTEGAEFHFRLKFIPLGRDADGDDYGSCVIEHVKAEDKPKVKKRTAAQKAALAVLAKLSPKGEPVNVDDVVLAIIRAKGFKADAIKGYHKRDANRTLIELQDAGDMWIDEKGMCGKGGAVRSDEGWL